MVSVKISVLDITPCRLANIYQRFVGSCRLLLQGRSVEDGSRFQRSGATAVRYRKCVILNWTVHVV